jgi:hypothetical protein
MTYRMIFGECDCCGTRNRVLHRGEAAGCEAYACAECRCGELGDDMDDLADEIERLLPLAENGKQHAHIYALEAALIEARADFNKYHDQFGVGA